MHASVVYHFISSFDYKIKGRKEERKGYTLGSHIYAVASLRVRAAPSPHRIISSLVSQIITHFWILVTESINGNKNKQMLYKKVCMWLTMIDSPRLSRWLYYVSSFASFYFSFMLTSKEEKKEPYGITILSGNLYLSTIYYLLSTT